MDPFPPKVLRYTTSLPFFPESANQFEPLVEADRAAYVLLLPVRFYRIIESPPVEAQGETI